MTDNSQRPTGFLSPKFGMDPEEAAIPDWEDEEVEDFITQLLDGRPNTGEDDQVQAVHQARDSLIRQLQMAWELKQLGFVTKRFHAMISKAEALAHSMVHKRSDMLDALNLADAMYTAALEATRHRLESKLADEQSERERKRLQRQKEEEERRERDERRQKERKEQEERERRRRDERDRLQPSSPIPHLKAGDKCPQCGGVLGFGCRLCYTCASGLGPKSASAPTAAASPVMMGSSASHARTATGHP